MRSGEGAEPARTGLTECCETKARQFGLQSFDGKWRGQRDVGPVVEQLLREVERPDCRPRHLLSDLFAGDDQHPGAAKGSVPGRSREGSMSEH